MDFEVYKMRDSRVQWRNSVSEPDSFPCWELVFDHHWDDYFTYRTLFGLWFIPEPDEDSWVFIGRIKIGCDSNDNTFDAIPKKFSGPLPEDFFSLPEDLSFYEKLRKVVSLDEAQEVLRFLRDCATDINILENFDHHRVFRNSLTREIDTDIVLSNALSALHGRSFSERLSFSLPFTVGYNREVAGIWEVKINEPRNRVERIYGIIGENGVGKTSMLKKFVRDLTSSQQTSELSEMPLFNAVSVISASESDNYMVLHQPRIPTSITNITQNREAIQPILESIKKLSERHKDIDSRPLITVYKNMLREFLGDQADMLFLENQHPFTNSKFYTLRENKLVELVSCLSSGQLHIFSMATYLMANLHGGSVVIIDEPELHLHPSSVVMFMSFLSKMLESFRSFAIIASHSPLIVREMMSNNVYHFNRFNGDIPSVGLVSFDTFGENIGELYRNIFGYDESKSLFTEVVEEIADQREYIPYNEPEEDLDKLMERVDRAISSDTKMNLNARMRIMDILRKAVRKEKGAEADA